MVVVYDFINNRVGEKGEDNLLPFRPLTPPSVLSYLAVSLSL